MDRSLIGRGRSSGVEHNLAKVGVVGSNPIARSKINKINQSLTDHIGAIDSAYIASSEANISS
jgi:hypothetical protein